MDKIIVKNQECKEAIKEIDKEYVESFDSSSEPVFFEKVKAEVHLPLQKTLRDPIFDRVFDQISSVTISGLTNPSNVKIYGVDVNNCKFKFRALKEYLVDNIGSYVFSRAKANRYTTSGKSASIGSQALVKFMQAYGTCAETVLGEMLLYVFMEQELNAPKIMRKIEIDELGGRVCSKSDGVHLLAVDNNGQLFHQLVFGASDIFGDLTASIDRAFDKIIDIEKNSDFELKMVENTTHNNIYDPDTTNYMVDLLLPKKSNVPKPDMAYGIFLGYTLSLGYNETDNNKYRAAVKTQMQNDIVSLQPYIEQKIRDNGLSGYNFYLYVVPFNDAPTAGDNQNSICWEVHQKALDIMAGRKNDPTFYPVIYGAALEDDWSDPKVWKKANPSLGITVSMDKVKMAYESARQNPAEENSFRQLRLNQWVKQAIRWMPMDKWDACAFPVNPESLKGRVCYGGLDLSSSTDITAFVLVFSPLDEDDKYVVLPYFWIPEDSIDLRVRRDHVNYDVWEKQGFLLTTEGNVVHYGFIETFIEELGMKYNIREIAFDRWGAVQMTQNLENLGFTVVPFGQGFKDMSPPTKELMKLTLEQKIAHGGHPVLRWMMDNIFIRTDPAGNIKADKEKSTEKIDGAVATIMALDRAIRCGGETGNSVYDDRGLLIF